MKSEMISRLQKKLDAIWELYFASDNITQMCIKSKIAGMSYVLEELGYEINSDGKIVAIG